MVLTQLPQASDVNLAGPWADGMLRAAYGAGARIVVVSPGSPPKVLSRGFYGACDPAVSLDAKRILFAGKRTPQDVFNVYEMGVDGSGLRQITRDLENCRSPSYQSTLYTIVSTEPWYQITFVSDAAGTVNEHGNARGTTRGTTLATALYSCMLDGSSPRRLTYNLSSDFDPVLMADGRLLFSSWQRATLRRGALGRIGLFGVAIDGTDFAAFCVDQGKRVKQMPCTTAGGLAVFVESDRLPWDGAGTLSCVQLRRPLHSYRPITRPADGLFHSPSPLPDGRILVSRRPADGSRTHGVWRLDPSNGKAEPIFDDPRFHDIQAKLIVARDEPDGRSSVVNAADPHGKLYCLNVNLSDFQDPKWLPPGTVKRLRVLEGIPRGSNRDTAASSLPDAAPPLAQRRILGEVPVAGDGSFNIEIPANTPIELQILDADHMALRSCSWVWARNREPRGCIGCHEDGELTPENTFQEAFARPSIPLCLPAERRRTVDFRRDLMPIIERKCVGCHEEAEAEPRLDGAVSGVDRAYANLLTATHDERERGQGGKYVHPGRARTSPLIWHIVGRNTSRPWDGAAVDADAKPIPAEGSPAEGTLPLTEDEKRLFVEWIDMGALWNGIPSAGERPGD